MKRIALLSLCLGVFIYGCAKQEETTTTTPAPSTGTTNTSTVAYSDVQSIFSSSCMPCHNAQNAKDGVVLTSYETVMKGGKDGAIVKPGDPDNSIIIHALRGTHNVKRMPFGKSPLPDSDIQKIEAWIKDGAKS